MLQRCLEQEGGTRAVNHRRTTIIYFLSTPRFFFFFFFFFTVILLCSISQTHAPLLVSKTPCATKVLNRINSQSHASTKRGKDKAQISRRTILTEYSKKLERNKQCLLFVTSLPISAAP